jgi:hypothetical protein
MLLVAGGRSSGAPVPPRPRRRDGAVVVPLRRLVAERLSPGRVRLGATAGLLGRRIGLERLRLHLLWVQQEDEDGGNAAETRRASPPARRAMGSRSG